MDEYRAAAAATKQSTDRYTRGKVVPVDAKDGRIDGAVLFSLPPEMRPSSPAEVETIVWEDCRKITLGSYGGRGAAEQWECKVTVIDKVDQIITARSETILGSEPPATSKNGTSKTGSWPAPEIVNFLRSLPRK